MPQCRYFAIKDCWPSKFISLPTFGTWQLDFGPVLAWDTDAWSAVVAYALVMIFDIGGALYGLCSLAGKPSWTCHVQTLQVMEAEC
jgi:hypothetical protein